MLDESSSSSLHPEYGITQAIWLAGEAHFYQKIKPSRRPSGWQVKHSFTKRLSNVGCGQQLVLVKSSVPAADHQFVVEQDLMLLT